MERKIEKRTCRKCRLKKEITMFCKKKENKGGYNTLCKPCKRAIENDRYRSLSPAQKEKRLENQRKWRRDNPIKKYIDNVARLTLKDVSLKQQLYVKFLEQPKKCPYTGRELILGKNIAADHIKPKSRFPSLIGNLDNIQFIDSKINKMKQDFTHEEFLDMCEHILKYTGRLK